MKLGIISLSYIFPSEAEVLSHFFENGVDFVVIRKPQNLERDIIRLIQEIPRKHHDKIIVQDRFSLLKHFKLNGVLLSKKNPQAPVTNKNFTKSVSCSRIEDVMKYQNFHNIFFGPVFDSISKDAKSPFGQTALLEAKEKNIIGERVIAMGGINEDTIQQAKLIGFKRVAVFGSLWENYPSDEDKDALYARFDRMMEACKSS